MNQTEFKKRSVAGAKVRSLLSEGYTVVSRSDSLGIVTLRHYYNGNYMQVEIGKVGVYTYKNGELVTLDVI